MQSDGADFRDTLYTVDKRGRRNWVYPRYLPGRLFKSRTVVAYVLMAFYLSLPWVVINGRQGVLLDIPHRRFTFFGAEFWATDTIYLFLALALLALSLFFFTALLGRVWCGWACPETVFLEFLFRPIERLIEGNDSARRKLDQAPWTVQKIARKGLKHALCALAAWIIASTTLAYFIGRETLLTMMTHSPLENPTAFALTLAVMGVMAFQFGWFREQFCTVLCPYARFQSVLMDKHSLLVGYDARRGEPRGKPRPSAEPPLGDCVDCGLCVRVCPTGIDIRNGTQLECIACTACIDACNSVMQGLKRAPDLIRYDTEAHLAGERRQWIRPRIFVYAAILLTIAGAFVTKISVRELSEIELVRPQGTEPFSVSADGVVTNQFTVRISNKSQAVQRFNVIQPHGGVATVISPLTDFTVEPGREVQVPLFIRMPRASFSAGSAHVPITIESSSGVALKRNLAILGPAS